jgi:hypothetical protein
MVVVMTHSFVIELDVKLEQQAVLASWQMIQNYISG